MSGACIQANIASKNPRKFEKINPSNLRCTEVTLIAPGRNGTLTIHADRVVTQELCSRPLGGSIQLESYRSARASTRLFRNYRQHCWSILDCAPKAIPPRRDNPARLFSWDISQIENHYPKATGM